jgi:hypothetical protein
MGEALNRAGDLSGAKEALESAAEIARTNGDVQSLTRAALGLGPRTVYVVGLMWDPRLIALLEEAEDAWAGAEEPLRVRLLSDLARAQWFTYGPSSQARPSAERAVAMARRTGSASSLAYALNSLHITNWHPDRLSEREAAASEIVLRAREAGDREAEFQGRFWHFLDSLELCDIDAADNDLAACADLAGRLRQPFFSWRVEHLNGIRAMVEGRFADGWRFAETALEFGKDCLPPGMREADHAMHLLASSTLEGRHGELDPLIVPLAETWARVVPAMAAMLATYHAEAGREDIARAGFERFAANDFALPREGSWMTAMVFYSELCSRFGDQSHAELLYARLAPYEGQCATAGDTGQVLGAVPHFLGILAATKGDLETAEWHFESAIEVQHRMRARPLVARTQFEWAKVLMSRSKRGDESRARGLLTDALGTARELGMAGLIRQVEAIGFGSLRQKTRT